MSLSGSMVLPGAETPDPAAVAEADGTGATVGNATTREILFYPKAAVASFEVQRTVLNAADPGMDAYFAGLMIKKHQADFEKKALAQILSEITGAVVSTTHSITGADLLALVDGVSNAIDLPVGSSFLTNWTMFNKLKTLKRLDTSVDRAVLENDMIWDIPAVASALVSKTATTNYDPIIFGAWSNCALASFGNGVNIVVDPYTKAIKNQVVLTSQAEWDAHITDTKAFYKCVSAN
jgi:HK97 family phage major capsid protein